MNLILAVVIGCAAVYGLAHLIAFWRVCEDRWQARRKAADGVNPSDAVSALDAAMLKAPDQPVTSAAQAAELERIIGRLDSWQQEDGRG